MEAAEVIRVIDTLASRGIPAGITGGWGVDALLRRQTRPHGDLDLGISAEDVDAAVDALRSSGYVVVKDQRPARLELAAHDDKVDLHPIMWGPTGDGTQSGFNGESFHYPAGSLSWPGEIGGREVRCGSPDLQVKFHSHYEPRAHDRADMAALKKAFHVRLPAAYLE